MTDPKLPGVIKIEGSSNSVIGDTIRVTVYSGSNARGTTTTTLNSDKRAIVDLLNFATDYVDGDTIVVSEIGKGLGGNSATLAGGASVSITATTGAFPSRSL